MRDASARRRTSPADQGLMLVEAVVAMTLIGLLVGSLSVAVISAMNAVATLRHRQLAAQIATRALESALAVDAQVDSNGCTRLLQGRAAGPVTSAWSQAAGLGVDLTRADPAWAQGVCAGRPPILPLQGIAGSYGAPPTHPVLSDGIAFTVRTYIGTCYVVPAQGCLPRARSGGATTRAFQVTVAVTWNDRSCPNRPCLRTATTVIDPATDPVFLARSTSSPVAVPDRFCVAPATPTAINVRANDTGALGTNPVTVVLPPTRGRLGDLGPGTAGYTPAAGFTGTDSFTYRLIDVNGRVSPTTTVTITVAATC